MQVTMQCNTMYTKSMASSETKVAHLSTVYVVALYILMYTCFHPKRLSNTYLQIIYMLAHQQAVLSGFYLHRMWDGCENFHPSSLTL